MTTPHFSDAAGATDSISVVQQSFLPPYADAAGATDALSVAVTNTLPTLADAAGAVDEIHVVKFQLPPVPSQAGLAILTSNPSFATGVPPWTMTNGTLTAGTPPSSPPQPTGGHYV